MKKTEKEKRVAKFMSDFTAARGIKRFRTAVRCRTVSFSALENAYQALVDRVARLLSNKGGLLKDVNSTQAAFYDYKNAVGLACDVQVKKDPKASAIGYVSERYEQIFDHQFSENEDYRKILMSIARSRKGKLAIKKARKALGLPPKREPA